MTRPRCPSRFFPRTLISAKRQNLSPDGQNSQNNTVKHHVLQIWTPVLHALQGNEGANEFAQGLISRAGSDTASTEHILSEKDRLLTYQEVTQYYIKIRKEYPEAARKIRKKEESLRRKIHVGIHPNPLLLLILPRPIWPKCKDCESQASMVHIIWTSPQVSDGTHTRNTWGLWGSGY